MHSLGFAFLCLFFSVFLETLAGSLGIVVPLTAVCVFYLSISFGLLPGMLAGVLAGTALDLLYGRSSLLSPFAMIIVSSVSYVWLYKGDTLSAVFHLLPGAAAGFIAVFPGVLLGICRHGNFVPPLMSLAFASLCASFMLPTLIFLCDHFAEKVALPLYRTARSRAEDRR